MAMQSVNNPFLFDETPEPVLTKPKTSNVDDILNLFDQPPPQPLTKTNMVSTSKGFDELLELNNPFDAPNSNLWSTGQSVATSSTVPTSTVANSTANSVPPKLITNDLESSLARLADNLTLSPSKPRGGGGSATGTAVQWNSQKGAGTGVWNQSATNTYQPMNQQGNQPLFNCGLDGSQPQQLKDAEFDPFRNL